MCESHISSSYDVVSDLWALFYRSFILHGDTNMCLSESCAPVSPIPKDREGSSCQNTDNKPTKHNADVNYESLSFLK